MERPLGRPATQGLYDPAHEHDACGVGFVAQIDGTKSHALVHQGIQVLERDVAGYWEQRGYHDRGDPFREERYR